jgi:alpha-amylase
VTTADYLGIGYASGGAADITEFTFVGVGNKFRGVNGERLAQLNPQGSQGNQFSAQAWGMLPSDKAVAFLQNHDTQHDCGLGYRHGMTFRLANVWMLATPYGYPSILSSFAFVCPTGNSMGPPSDASGWTLNVRCAAAMDAAVVGEWVCEHRDPYIRNMVRFRKAVAGTDVTLWWDNGNNAIAFSRGSKGFVAINREPTPVSLSTATGLPAGTYCDVISGGKVGPVCAGASVVVGDGGRVSFTLASNQAVVVESGGRL